MAAALVASASSARSRPAVEAGVVAVAADHPLAAGVGLQVLEQWGATAADGVIAAALAMGVASPQASGLGGGGFALCWDAARREPYALDFRETAPATTDPTRYALPKGAPGALDAARGGASVAVPGEPAGLDVLRERLGGLGRPYLAAGAATLAERGIWLTGYQAGLLGRAAPLKGGLGVLGEALWPGGDPIGVGARYTRPDLARTLRRYGEEGPAALTSGEAAAATIRVTERDGGPLSVADLAAYRPVEREPLRVRRGPYTLYAFPPPGGGVVLLEALALFDAMPGPVPAPGTAAWFHRIAEALHHAFADRAGWLGDPSATEVPVAAMLDPGNIRTLAARSVGRATKDPAAMGVRSLPGAPPVPPIDVAPGGGGTANLVASTPAGGACALTTTVNLPFGSGLVVPETGVLLNDEMDDFATRPSTPNAFGLPPGGANLLRPGKRPASSMSPLLVLRDDRVALALGGSGGPAIVSSTLQVLLRLLDGAEPLDVALAAPRIHAMWAPLAVWAEEGIGADVRSALAEMGHEVAPYPLVPAVTAIDLRGSEPVAGADPRKGGKGLVGARRPYEIQSWPGRGSI